MRSRYLDVLRTVAIFRVVVYHATGWTILTVVFPAIGVMFAVAGSLMAASLDRHGLATVGRRLRRTLPPLWTVAAIAIPVMLLSGMAADWRLLYWVLPLRDPPVHGWGVPALGAVWYLRQYVWFVLLSPVALPLFRRFPVPVLLAPLALLGAMVLGLPAVGSLLDFGVYSTCWLLGFAHHDGMLRRASPARLLVTVGVLTAGAVAWLVTHPVVGEIDLNHQPVPHALWSAAVVLVLLGLVPRASGWLRHRIPATWFVTMLSRRAVTVYLWHQPVIVGLGLIIGFIWLGGIDLSGPLGRVAWLSAVGVGLVVCVAAFGWVEDLAARRRPVLLPGRQEWARARANAPLP